MNLVAKVNRIVEEDQLLKPGDSIVVAVSGGPDSTALLELLFLLSGKWGWTLTAAHANHGFRPEESEREAEFVRALAEERGIPFVYRKLDVPGRLRESGGNPQNVARELRYRFLLETAAERGAGSIALAHHADDQAETVLMRMLRGTGISGLAGIPPKRMEQNVELIRPLLRITKNELLEDLRQRGIGYCTDSSNEKTKYTRNKVRLEALPYLSRFNPSLPEALNRLAILAAGENDYLEREAERTAGRIALWEAGAVRFRRHAWEELHVALQRRVLKLILNYVSPVGDSRDFGELERLRELLLQSGKPNLELEAEGGVRIVREYDEVWVKRDSGPQDSLTYCYSLEGEEGEVWIPEASCRLIYRLATPEEAVVRMSPDTGCFDPAALRYPLEVRNRRPGDRMQPDGLNGSKKVKDIFIDRKLPAAQRERIPILADADGTLLWIPGVARSGTAKVTDCTTRVLCVSTFPL